MNNKKWCYYCDYTGCAMCRGSTTLEQIKSKRGYQAHGQKSKKITIRVPEELLESFDKQARKRGNNRSEVILHLMNAWLKA